MVLKKNVFIYSKNHNLNKCNINGKYYVNINLVNICILYVLLFKMSRLKYN